MCQLAGFFDPANAPILTLNCISAGGCIEIDLICNSGWPLTHRLQSWPETSGPYASVSRIL